MLPCYHIGKTKIGKEDKNQFQEWTSVHGAYCTQDHSNHSRPVLVKSTIDFLLGLKTAFNHDQTH